MNPICTNNETKDLEDGLKRRLKVSSFLISEYFVFWSLFSFRVIV